METTKSEIALVVSILLIVFILFLIEYYLVGLVVYIIAYAVWRNLRGKYIGRQRFLLPSEDNVMEDRERVIAYMKEHERTYPSDISDDLGIEYDEVGKIIEHLKEEGVVEFADDKKE